jgi:hypothetical protein
VERDGEASFSAPPQRLRARRVAIEGDHSSGSYLLAAWKGEDDSLGRAVIWWTRRAFRLDGRALELYVLMTGLVCSLAGLVFLLRGVWLSVG